MARGISNLKALLPIYYSTLYGPTNFGLSSLPTPFSFMCLVLSSTNSPTEIPAYLLPLSAVFFSLAC